MADALRVISAFADESISAASGLQAAVDAYVDGPRPLFSRLPVSYRLAPLPVRTRLLRTLARMRPAADSAFPSWPIERRIDDLLDGPGHAARYNGRRVAVVITHDIDSEAELDAIAQIRAVETTMGVRSSFGFVPRESWPSEELARTLVAQGCEVYWHDIGHDGRLPYLAKEEIRAAFDRVLDTSPWAGPMMRTFRSGQLLMSRTLLEVVAERFAIDMSLPDTERSGPYGGAAGCGTVLPFRVGPLVELPLTMPQEVYLRQVYGLSADQALEIWTKKLRHISSVGGVAVLNVHPVWVGKRYPDMRRAFETFLGMVSTSPDVTVTTPRDLLAMLGGGPG